MGNLAEFLVKQQERNNKLISEITAVVKQMKAERERPKKIIYDDEGRAIRIE